MAKAKYAGPADRLEQYEAIVAAADVDRKGAGTPYTSRNGWMTSFLDKQGAMAIRLGPNDRVEFVAEFDTSIAQQHGSTMPEFAVVPDAVFRDDDIMADWFVRSWTWVGTLDPKPTKKR